MARSPAKSWGVMFDVDGVLIDSFSAFKTVWREWSAIHSIEFDRVWAATHGRRPVDTIAEVAPNLDAEQEYSWLQSRVRHPDLEFPAFDGAQQFLRALPSTTWALVTSSYEPAVRARFRNAGLPHPEHIVDATRVSEGAPQPHCYELGASLLGVHPEKCLVLEDSPAGIAAGLQAGCYVVAIASTHKQHELEKANEIVPSLVEAQRVFERWLMKRQ